MAKYFSGVLDREVEKTKRQIENLHAKLECFEIMDRLEDLKVQVKIEDGAIYFFQTLYRKDRAGKSYIYLKSFEKIYRKSWRDRADFLKWKLKDIEAGQIQLEQEEI